MCRVKAGTEITELADIQNLVTACILRSRQPYTIPGLSREVFGKCIGSSISITDKQIEEMVRDTTIALLRSKCISVNEGHYYARPVFHKCE